MLALAVLLLAIARRLRLPYPALLALAGAAVAIAPVDVGLHLDPELALALFIAPVLLDAAYDTSLRDLKRHWAAVASLVLIAVGLTTVAVALVVHALAPTIPWAAAIAIGAIVAPPDAVAATTVLRDIRLPHRVSVILEGVDASVEPDRVCVLHVPNVPSGGQVENLEIREFLARGSGGPEHQKLLRLIGTLVDAP